MAQVNTRTGVLEGTVGKRGVQAFLGVPYAEPPVGELRWRPPVSLASSDEVIECKELGYTAMQFEDEVEPASLWKQSEDCLSLNIWVKDMSKASQPVMVYIHGGAFFSGGSADPLYDGAALASSHDVVVVSINYRLNVFGSLQLSALPGGEEYSEAGYLNLLDQIEALRWIQDNIALFGGDPTRVTVFGESAGSASAALLAVSPRAKGLFRRAICESGPIQLYKTPEMAAPYAVEFAEIMGCANVQELVAKSNDEILQGMRELCARHKFEVSLIFSPVCDGSLVPSKPQRAWRDGAADDVDIMIGSTEDEFNYFIFYFAPEEMPDFWHGQTKFHFDGKVNIEDWEQKWRDANPDIDFYGTYTEFMNQTGFRVGADLMAADHSRGGTTYNYLFKYKSRLDGMGSCHAIELPFVFDALDNKSVEEHIIGPGAPQHLADEMGQIWYSFAADGVPSCAGVPTWPKFSEDDQAYMVIDESCWRIERGINTRNNELFADMYKPLLDELEG